MNQASTSLVPIETSEAVVMVQRVLKIAAILSRTSSTHGDEATDNGDRGENLRELEIRYPDISE